MLDPAQLGAKAEEPTIYATCASNRFRHLAEGRLTEVTSNVVAAT